MSVATYWDEPLLFFPTVFRGSFGELTDCGAVGWQVVMSDFDAQGDTHYVRAVRAAAEYAFEACGGGDLLDAYLPDFRR
jgi:hypothetical protein